MARDNPAEFQRHWPQTYAEVNRLRNEEAREATEDVETRRARRTETVAYATPDAPPVGVEPERPHRPWPEELLERARACAMTPEEYARQFPQNTRAFWYGMREAAHEEAMDMAVAMRMEGYVREREAMTREREYMDGFSEEFRENQARFEDIRRSNEI